MNKFEETLVSVTEKRFEKKLTRAQIARVLHLYKAVDLSVFRNHDPNKVIVVLSKLFSDKLKEDIKLMNDQPDTFDLHDYQKKQIESDALTDDSVNVPYIDSDKLGDVEVKEDSKELTVADANALKLFLNPESMYEHHYLVLDSDYRDTNAENPASITKFTWRYATTQDIGTGYCNSVGVIKNIVGMRMYQPRVPYLAGMDTTAKRVSVLIEELSAQSFIGENGRRFHFLLRPNFTGGGQTSIELSTEDYNDGIFNFTTPIQSFPSITLSFGDPLNILTFATPFTRFIVPFEFTCLKGE